MVFLQLLVSLGSRHILLSFPPLLLLLQLILSRKGNRSLSIDSPLLHNLQHLLFPLLLPTLGLLLTGMRLIIHEIIHMASIIASALVLPVLPILIPPFTHHTVIIDILLPARFLPLQYLENFRLDDELVKVHILGQLEIELMELDFIEIVVIQIDFLQIGVLFSLSKFLHDPLVLLAEAVTAPVFLDDHCGFLFAHLLEWPVEAVDDVRQVVKQDAFLY